MFDRVLVANRGEIAVRIIRACRELGLESVLVCSEADRQSLPAELADRVVCLPGFKPAETYLNMAAIIQAAREAGCQAVHPGYGYLSENPQFARRCQQAGLVFIGPSP
ncbi:MAG: biotin carboxylase N-terminal domain-containing protein, partial [Desulfurispora sp.]|uniref:biotin carboxylase N-terminal domain-containing protein n=1 Tax=Desulfurispora sp. TaxID=3014275 RepID=UPI00404AE9A0